MRFIGPVAAALISGGRRASSNFWPPGRSARQTVPDLESFEDELHAIFTEAEAEALGEELSRFDVDLPSVSLDGVEHRRVLRCEQRYMSAAGPVSVIRSLYSTRQDAERAVCPMELRAGIVEGYWTPRAAMQATFAVTHLPPQEAENPFAQVGSMRPSKSSLAQGPQLLRLHARYQAAGGLRPRGVPKARRCSGAQTRTRRGTSSGARATSHLRGGDAARLASAGS
jgi:hypothetical protein